MGTVVVAEKDVKKQLELDLRAPATEAHYQAQPQPCAEVICLSEFKKATARQSPAVTNSLNKDTIKSRIESLLARYK